MNINLNQASKRWNTLTPYLAFLFGVLILLIVVVSSKTQDSPEKLQDTRDHERPLETSNTPTPVAAQDQNATITSGIAAPVPTSTVPAQADPFKAFLEAHKNIQPPANAQPKPQTPEEIRNAFKAAVEKNISSAYPFANGRKSNSTDGSQSNR